MNTEQTAFHVSVLALILAFLAVPAFGGSVSSFACSATVETSQGNYVSVSNSSSSCSVGAGGGGAFASASAFAEIGGVVEEPPFPSGTVVPPNSTIYGTLNAIAQSSPVPGNTCGFGLVDCNSGASVNASETITFQTLGHFVPASQSCTPTGRRTLQATVREPVLV